MKLKIKVQDHNTPRGEVLLRVEDTNGHCYGMAQMHVSNRYGTSMVDYSVFNPTMLLIKGDLKTAAYNALQHGQRNYEVNI